MLNIIFSLLSGLIFGFGLTVSSMINPNKVISFLDITGKWDPSLMFVMIGAIVFCSPIFYVLKNKTKPFFASKFERPAIKDIDSQLIFGASLFGLGWGMVGLWSILRKKKIKFQFTRKLYLTTFLLEIPKAP